MDDIDKAVNDFRRQLGMSGMKPRAYIFDRTGDKCQLLEDIMWPQLESYDVVHVPDSTTSLDPLFDKDVVIMGDPLGNLSAKIVMFARTSQKQLVMRAKNWYEVKPLQP